MYKLKRHSITAFGYDFSISGDGLVDRDWNPYYEKSDIIKALDFWIAHWVYQNQLDYTFMNTVNVDFEITLKELILVREKIMKMPVDTMFTRHKIRDDFKSEKSVLVNGLYMTQYDIDIRPEVKYSEAVIGDGTGSSVVDPFCYKVITRTREQVNKNLKDLSNNASTAAETLQQLFTDITTHAGEAINDISRVQVSVRRQGVPTAHGFEGSTSSTTSFEITDANGNVRRFDGPITSTENIQLGNTININGMDVQVSDIRFRMEEPHPNTEFEMISVPVEVSTITVQDDEEPEAIGIMGEGGLILHIVGEAGEPLNIGDLIYQNNDTDLKWYKGPRTIGNIIHTPTHICCGRFAFGEMVEAVQEVTVVYPPETTPTLYPGDSILTNNLNNDVLVRRNRRMNTISNDIITYNNMNVGVGGFSHTDPNSFVTVPVEFHDGRTHITTNIFFNADDSLAFARSFNSHTIRITPRADTPQIFQIDDKLYHIVNMNISHDPSQSMNGFVFRNLFINSIKTTRSLLQNTLELNFEGVEGLIRYNLSITVLVNPNILTSNQGPWELEILGDNRVRIGGEDDVYTVIRPIDIEIR